MPMNPDDFIDPQLQRIIAGKSLRQIERLAEAFGVAAGYFSAGKFNSAVKALLDGGMTKKEILDSLNPHRNN